MKEGQSPVFAQSRVLTKTISMSLLAAWLASPGVSARKFYHDDPLQKTPPPMNVEKVDGRKLNNIFDFFYNTFYKPGELRTKGVTAPAQAVNTLGEVPDSAWYTNRHGKVRMSLEELVRGPGDENAPDLSGPLTVIAAKTQGISPGFTMRDAKGRKYIVKFDPKSNPEMATAADAITSKFFYALGYNVPENYIFTFRHDQLRIAPDVTVRDALGRIRPMHERDVTQLLIKVPRTADGRYRAVASLFLQGQPVGEFRYHGTRQDDPNDIVPHEHRRDLRGLSVFCAWLNHDDSRAINTLDLLVEENGVHFLKHYLIDFGSTLGSASTAPNSPRGGNEYLFTWTPALKQIFSLGLFVPRWAKADFPDIPAVGRFEYAIFDPEKWVPEYPNAAFINRLPDDAFWAAKQVMAFTDDEIRALVKTGEYSERRAEDWIVRCLIERRDKIGRAFFAKVLPLDSFAVEGGRLAFEDLELEHGFITSRDYKVQWSRFNNDTEEKTPLSGESGFALPAQALGAAEGEYFAADISGPDPKKAVIVYIRKKAGRLEVVGIDRTW